jgi:hypothetical protein
MVAAVFAASPFSAKAQQLLGPPADDRLVFRRA